MIKTTTSNTKYVLEGKTLDAKTWFAVHKPTDSQQITLKYKVVCHCLYSEYRLIEIITTTTVTTKVVG